MKINSYNWLRKVVMAGWFMGFSLFMFFFFFFFLTLSFKLKHHLKMGSLCLPSGEAVLSGWICTWYAYACGTYVMVYADCTHLLPLNLCLLGCCATFPLLGCIFIVKLVLLEWFMLGVGGSENTLKDVFQLIMQIKINKWSGRCKKKRKSQMYANRQMLTNFLSVPLSL